MYNEDVKSLAEFPFSHPQELQENSQVFSEKQGSLKIGSKTTTVSVVMNARTVVETEVEGGGATDERNQESTAVKIRETGRLIPCKKNQFYFF